ncbi:MAG: Pseudogene of conserved hypothetical protein [Methanobrevibacter sp. CfCl-M3]
MLMMNIFLNDGFSSKQSMWGEIIVGSVLEEVKKHLLPAYKLRHREVRDKAMRGKADLVSCKFENDRPIIIFTEVKSKRTYNKTKDENICTKAYESLEKNDVESPEMINHISDYLEKEDKYDLMDIFDEAIRNPKSYSREFNIFIVMEKSIWDEIILENLNENELKLFDLSINILLIDSLKELVENSY